MKSKLVAEFIEALQKTSLDWTPGRPDVARLIESAVRRGVVQTRAALAREAGISKGSLHLYEHQGGNPSLDCLARLALAAGVGLAGLFVPEAWVERGDGAAFGGCAWLEPRRRRPRRNWVDVSAHVEGCLISAVPVTTAELARKIGTCPSYLRKQIGSRATDLDEAVRNRNEQLRQEAAKRLAGVIEEKATLLTAAGVKVSVRKLAKSVNARRNSRRFNTALAIARARGGVKPVLLAGPTAADGVSPAAPPASGA
jgi:DNA-binding XRE family transcriptional regulator